MTKILVIEDHEMLRTQIMSTLETKQYDVSGAPDGHIGLQLAREMQPDLILCDVMMSTVNGFEVLQQLRSWPGTSSTPFIFMTARSDRDAMRYGMSLGADDFIIKPFTTGELLDAVRMRLERREAMVRDAERTLDQSRQQLMHMITHELRTPLTSINMAVDLMSRQLDGVDPEELHNLVDTLGAGSRRLSRVVDQTVLVAHLQSGAISSTAIAERGVPMSISEVVVGAISMGRRFAYRNPNVNIDLVDPDVHARVRCNPQSLKHAIGEIIGNALIFSPEGATVCVSMRQDGERVLITVADEGPGIEPDQIQQALQLFQQINRETQEQQGMGLGLGIALQLIEAHAGALQLVSAPGRGTIATVELPVALED